MGNKYKVKEIQTMTEFGPITESREVTYETCSHCKQFQREIEKLTQQNMDFREALEFCNTDMESMIKLGQDADRNELMFWIHSTTAKSGLALAKHPRTSNSEKE